MKKGKKRGKIHPKDVMILIVRSAFFVLYPALFSSAFTGVKEIIIRISGLKNLEWTAFSATLVLLLVITFCFGRIFCGFACAFGTYGDFLYFLSAWIRKKCKKRPFHVFERWQEYLKYLKYFVLLGVLVLCALGMQDVISENSPWTAFSLLCSGKLPDAGFAVLLFGLISLGMLLEPRFFCRFFCPMGAVFALMPVMPQAVIKRDRQNCIKGCNLCQRTCPAALEIPDRTSDDSMGMGECFACRKCMQKCPGKNRQVMP